MLFGKCSDFTIDNRLSDNDAVAGAYFAPQMKVSSRIASSMPIVIAAAPSTRDASREERHLQIPRLGNLVTGSHSTTAFETPIQGSAALGDFTWPAVR
jgi:hypothetical protein